MLLCSVVDAIVLCGVVRCIRQYLARYTGFEKGHHERRDSGSMVFNKRIANSVALAFLLQSTKDA